MKTKSGNGIMFHLTALCFAIWIMGVAGCTADKGAGAPGINEVWMQNITFVPATLTVQVNTMLKWTNHDNTSHTVTSDDNLFDSGIIPGGSTFSRQFTATGTYTYHCNIHSVMTGKIIVQ